MTRLLRARATVTLLALALAGCSATRLAYDHADLLLQWRAARYLDLDGARAAQLEARIAAFLGWHRAHALPQYARLAREAGDRVERGLTRADLEWGYDSMLTQSRESLHAAAAQLGDLLDRLTPAQIERLGNGLAEDNREFEEANLAGTPAERRARRLRRNVERLEDWMGTLTEAQIERVRRYAERAPLADELRARDIRRRQALLIDMVRAREAGRRLADWAARWDEGRDPEYASALRAQREEYFAMLLDLDRTLSAGQRRAVVRRLRALASDFTVLARRDAPRADPDWTAAQ